MSLWHMSIMVRHVHYCAYLYDASKPISILIQSAMLELTSKVWLFKWICLVAEKGAKKVERSTHYLSQGHIVLVDLGCGEHLLRSLFLWLAAKSQHIQDKQVLRLEILHLILRKDLCVEKKKIKFIKKKIKFISNKILIYMLMFIGKLLAVIFSGEKTFIDAYYFTFPAFTILMLYNWYKYEGILSSWV